MCVGGRWSVYEGIGDGLGLAVAMRVGLPTGDPAAFNGHGFVTGHAKVIGGWRPSRSRLGLSAGMQGAEVAQCCYADMERASL